MQYQPAANFAKLLLLLMLVLPTTGCQQLPVPNRASAEPANSPNSNQRKPSVQPKPGTYGPATTLATIRNPSVTESSGLVASRTMPGVYWTHNDSGDGPFLYAFDTTGNSRGVWRVTGASAIDWEDIAAGPGPQPNTSYLYIGDIGDNDSARSEIVVYRVKEPANASDTKSTKSKPLVTEPADAIRLRYPDGKHDAEALMVHPRTGEVYVITKVAFANSVVYKARLPLNITKVTTLTSIGEFKLPSLFGGIITGGDISPDGRRVALCDYFSGYEVVLPESSNQFDEIWKQRWTSIELGNRKQGEAIAYRLDGRALLATSEGRSTALIEVVRR